MPVSEDLLEILACPKCKGRLEYIESADRFDCHECKLGYPIEDGIPNFIIESAQDLSENE